jgi:phosphonate transport system substrate-binding protein
MGVNMLKVVRALFFCCLAILLTSCERAEQPQTPQYSTQPQQGSAPIYRFAIHPLHNPQKLTEIYQPLMDYLNRNIQGASFQLEASRDYHTYEAKFRAREAEFLLPNPWQTLQAMQAGYNVIAMAGDPEDFRGIILVRKNSAIRSPTDLKGKAVSYPSPTALAAAIMPQYYLHTHGVNITKDIDNQYVGSQESSIMNVYLKQVAAAATWPPPWRTFQKDHPEEAAQLRLAWETAPLINNSVMARNDVPADLQARVRELLIKLGQSKEGRDTLRRMETARFLPAQDSDYAVVRSFIERFEKEVRPVEIE